MQEVTNAAYFQHREVWYPCLVEQSEQPSCRDCRLQSVIIQIQLIDIKQDDNNSFRQ